MLRTRPISDRERTILDGLRQPEYAGGIPEVAKALWMSRSELKLDRLLDYAHRLRSGALRAPCGDGLRAARDFVAGSCVWNGLKLNGVDVHLQAPVRLKGAGLRQRRVEPVVGWSQLSTQTLEHVR